MDCKCDGRQKVLLVTSKLQTQLLHKDLIRRASRRSTSCLGGKRRKEDGMEERRTGGGREWNYE
jgi:hypothetical protein